jgi:hypothetical protein
MKYRFKPVVYVLFVALLGLVSLAATRVGAGTEGQQASGPEGIWGPPLGSLPLGPAVPLAPLAINEADREANATIVSDDFNWCDLDADVWAFLDPRGDSSYATTGTFTNNAWLEISVPADTTHDVWRDGNFSARVMQPAADSDLELQVKFESALNLQYQMQGIVVEESQNHFLRFEFYGNGTDTVVFAAILGPTASPPLTATKMVDAKIYSSGTAPLYMRVRRVGNQWSQYYSDNGVSWTKAVEFPHPLTVTAVGTYAANAALPGLSPPAHTAQIDYFFNTASPITPEDGVRNTLAVNVAGSGTVTKSPDRGLGSYGCDELVELIPNPTPGWQFSTWIGPNAGDLINNGDGTYTLPMDGDKQVTAVFAVGEYTMQLVVEPPDKGTVTKDPDKATYDYGEVVTLTATSLEAGWLFDKWSGDLTGSTSPVTVTMTSSKVITATFVRRQYSLTMLEPIPADKGTTDPGAGVHLYDPDEVVTLTALPAAGWYLHEWLGASGGEVQENADGTYSLMMDGDKEIQPRFKQAQYTLAVTIVGQGQVQRSLPEPYLYGEEVRLTPVPAAAFGGWSGPDADDLVPAGGSWILVMDGNKELTATFYHIFLPLVHR